MPNSIEASILATLAYSDIFDYPLTFEEIGKNLVFYKVTGDSLGKAVNKLLKEGKLLKFGNFYQLKRPENLAKKRLLRKKYAGKKISRAKFAAKILSLIPSVKFIGVSGAAAVKNSPKADDIDFFIICTKNTLFTTRFLATITLDFLNLRRRPAAKKITDKICLNMFLTEDDLDLAPHDLYLAHEILQLKPIFERDGTYQKFLTANSWVFKFLPNWEPKAKRPKTKAKRESLKALVVRPFALSVENLLKRFQLKYMARRRTKEIISDTKLFFHPANVHQKVLEEFSNRLTQFGVPLDPSTYSGSAGRKLPSNLFAP